MKDEDWPLKDLFVARLERNTDEIFSILLEMFPATFDRLLLDPGFDILREDSRFEAYLRQSPFGQVSDADVEAVVELIRE